MYHTVAIDSMYDMHLLYHVLRNIKHLALIHQWQQSLHHTFLCIIGPYHSKHTSSNTGMRNAYFTSVVDDKHAMHYELTNRMW